MRVAAVADIHSPKFLRIFEEALMKLGECDLFLVAGDLVLKNDHHQLPGVLRTIRRVYGGRLMACFGNEEYEQDREKYGSGDLLWIDDSSTSFEIGGLEVGIVGSRGSLDRPTFWQRTRVKGIWQIYQQRVWDLDRIIAGLRTDIKIVITHYAPTYENLEGERERAWPEMACKKFEEVIRRRKPDLWIHGHAHRATRFETTIGETQVVNVSLPARREIVVKEIP